MSFSPPRPDIAAAPAPETRPVGVGEDELWVRHTAPFSGFGRQTRHGSEVWNTLVLLIAGGVAGFLGGVLYEKSHGSSAGTVAPVVASAAITPAPEGTLPPSPPVGAAAITVRLQRIKALQTDVGDILKYAREMRRVATIPEGDGSYFPSEGQFAQLTDRFEWQQPGSPNFHRTPLLLVLGYAPDQTSSQQCADQMAQVLRRSGVTSPIYACGLGNAKAMPAVEPAGVGTDGRGVEIWVAFTLF